MKVIEKDSRPRGGTGQVHHKHIGFSTVGSADGQH